MKIIYLILAIYLTYWLRDRRNDQYELKDIDVTDLYTIKYQTYDISINESEIEYGIDNTTSRIFEVIRNMEDKFQPRIFGGWIRDRLIKHRPRDIDILIHANNITELSAINSKMKSYLVSERQNLNETNKFEIPIEIRGYGHEKIRLYGKELDILFMASNKTIVPPYQFTPTDNLTQDAMIKDMTINAIYYNIKNKQIEDPLNGFDDLKKGLIVTPFKIHPFNKDFFRTFRLFKTSAELSLKILDYILDYIKDNKNLIKTFLITYKNQTEKELIRITEGNHSLKAFKYIYDYDLLDVFIPKPYFILFNSEKIKFSNKIFNYLLISEFILKYGLMNFKNKINNVDKVLNKYELYVGAINITLLSSKSKVTSNSQIINNMVPIQNLLLKVAEVYCDSKKDICENNILTKINLKEIRKILSHLSNL